MRLVGEGSARLPTVHLLRSALVAASVLDPAGVAIAIAHRSYIKLPTGGLYHSLDLRRGEELLIRSGLVTLEEEVLCPSEQLQPLLHMPTLQACQVLLAVTATITPPLWIHSAVREDVVWPEFIADADADALAEVFPDPEEREAFLLSLGNQFDARARCKLGALGEQTVLCACKTQLEGSGRPDLAAAVQRVSLVSDQLGYDVVAPTLRGATRRLEVKTTGPATHGQMQLYLTRNEAIVGIRDPWWFLVVCRACDECHAEIMGWCSGQNLRDLLPHDTPPSGHWAVANLTLNREMLLPGLPPHE